MKEEGRSTFKILTDKPTRKIPLGVGGRTIFRMDLKELGINTRIELIQLRISITGEPL